MSAFTLGRLAEALGATLHGDAGQLVRGVAPLESAGPEEISFVTSPKYQRLAAASAAGALVVGPEVPDLERTLLRVASPPAALITLLRLFHPNPPVEPGVHHAAWVAPEARVHPTAAVGPGAVIEGDAVIGPRTFVGALTYVGRGAVLGADVMLYPRVVIRDGVRIGDRVIVHPGAVLGADGFGYAFDGSAHQKIPQVGGLIIEDDVEIGANSAIDRATMGATIVRRGTKIDNLVQIGHNCDIGEHVILVGQVGVSGSCKIGNRAVLAGQVGVADHVSIGEGAILTAQTGVAGDVPAGEVWAGYPARPATQMRRIWVAEAMLPELLKRVRSLEKQVRELGSRADG